MYLEARGSEDTLMTLDERFRESKIFSVATKDEFDKQPKGKTIDITITL